MSANFPGRARAVVRFGAIVGTAALALAACSSTPKANPGTSSGKTYTIAYEGPLSGGNPQLGLNMKFAVQLAIKQANAGTTFGTLPFKLAFLPEDDQGSPTQSPTAAQAVLDQSSTVSPSSARRSRGPRKAADPLFNAGGPGHGDPVGHRPDPADARVDELLPGRRRRQRAGPGRRPVHREDVGHKTVYAVDDASAYAAGPGGAFDTEATTAQVPSSPTRPRPARPSARRARATSPSTGRWPPR